MNETTDWAAIAQKLHQDCRALESKIAEVTKQRDAFHHELSKVMPPDYKDWWQNDKNEWPLIARLTIENKRRLIDMDQVTIERLEKDLSETTNDRDEWKERYERLNESLAKNKRLFSSKLAETIIADQVQRIKFLEDGYSKMQKELNELKETNK